MDPMDTGSMRRDAAAGAATGASSDATGDAGADGEALACWGVYSSECATRRTLARIADKWTMLIVGRLSAGPMRFAALRRSIEGLSAKVLTEHLRELAADGLVHRELDDAVRPPRTTYSLTPLGATLVDTAEAMRRWAEAHAEEIERHRASVRGARPDASRAGAGGAMPEDQDPASSG